MHAQHATQPRSQQEQDFARLCRYIKHTEADLRVEYDPQVRALIEADLRVVRQQRHELYIAIRRAAKAQGHTLALFH